MYRRSKFVEVLLDIREKMAEEAEFDVQMLADIVRKDADDDTPADDPAAARP